MRSIEAPQCFSAQHIRRSARMIAAWYIDLNESVRSLRRTSTHLKVVSECHGLRRILALQELSQIFDDEIRVIVRLDEPVALVKQIRIREQKGQRGLQG